jgi:parallel beta-helix repeat protein
MFIFVLLNPLHTFNPMKKHVTIFTGTFISMFLSISCAFLAPIIALGATYTVNTNTDTGAGAGLTGDLRYCITQANAIPGPHTINFSTGATTITLTGTLPVFTRQITVQATPGTIVINGNNIQWCFLFNDTGGASSVLDGLVVNRANTNFANIEINGVNGITIRNCYIGTNAAGNAAAASNPNFGITLINSSNNFILNNVISGHGVHGLLINVTSNTNTVRGNKIGCNLLGTAAIPNAVHGIELNNTSINNIIGGAAAADRNIVSGNTRSGISVVGASSGVQIINNYVGINLAGTAALTNGEHGIIVNGSASSTVTNNVASGNAVFGVFLTNSNNHVVKGNKIGVNAAGTAAVANTLTGLRFEVSNNAVVGGTAAGEGNTVSGNGEDGMRFQSVATATIQGNFVGTNSAGTAAIPNAISGIYGTIDCTNHSIGGNTVAARNIVSGNTVNGIKYDTRCNDLIIEGNYVGTDVTGAGAPATFGNGQIGIFLLNDCLRPRIGGTTTAQRNIVSGNGRTWVPGSGNGTGILFNGNITNAVITGNYIGLAADGSTAVPNYENGVVVLGASNNLTLGGNTAATRNVISSNGYQGVVVLQSDSPLIIGNYFGIDAGGTLTRGNGQSGVILIFVTNARVGRATANEGNVMSNNGECGLHIVGGNGNTAYNNLIGVAANGTTAMGNRNGGVFIQGVAGGTNGSSNTIGGLTALQPNTIAYSTGTGVNPDLGNGFGIGVAHNDQGIQNTFIGNKIFCNAGLGISLNLTGTFGGVANGVGNGGKAAPAITSLSPTVTSGTGTNGETIHVYSNVTCTSCQGETYLGSALVAGGVWSVTHVSVAVPGNNSATATSAALGTSQFTCNAPAPVELVYFKAKAQDNTSLLTWSTAMEKNNATFVIERSANGTSFESIGSVIGQGSTLQVTHYNFTDEHPFSGVTYYRLKQVDFDGTQTYTAMQAVYFETSSDFLLFPNPATNEVHVVVNSDEVYGIHLYSTLGVEVQQWSTTKNNNTYTIHLNGIAPGSYIIELRSATKQVTKSFLVY